LRLVAHNQRHRRVYAEGRPGYGKPVDVWSLGVIAFIMLGGRFPFVGATPQAVSDEGLAGRIRFTAGEPWSLISDEAFDFIRALLNPDQEARLTAEQALEHPVRSASRCLAGANSSRQWMKMEPEKPVYSDKATSEFIEHRPKPAQPVSRSTTKAKELANAPGGDTGALTLRRTITHHDQETDKAPV
jgi:serine/threonine protein kinase